MLKKIDLKEILKIFIIVIIISLIIITSKYIGLLKLLKKLIRSLFPILLAIAISFINEPLIKFISKYLKRKITVIIVYGLELIVIFLILLLVIPSFITQLRILLSEVPNIFNEIVAFTGEYPIKFDIQSTIESYALDIINLLSNLINVIIDIAIAFVGGFFLSFDYVKFKSSIKNYLLEKNKNKTFNFVKSFTPFIYKYTFCLLFDMVILWIISGISFYFAGLEYPFMFGAIIAICDLIPFFGPVIGGVPAIIVALTKSFNFALIILTIIICSQFIESNITKPFIMKSAISLHPLEGLIGIAIGGCLLGFFGLILSPIFVIGIKIYIKLIKEEKNKKI